MSHTPPIPQGNQSPYPLQEAPHQPVSAKLPPVVAHKETSVTDRVGALPLGAIGMAVGLGAAVIGGLLLLTGRDKPTEGKKRKNKG